MASSPARRDLIPYLILFIALLATAATAIYAYTSVRREERLRVENAADSVRATIDSRIDSYVAMLLGGAGLFAASADVSRAEFRAYVQRLELSTRYGGVQGIGYSRAIRAEERQRVLEEVRRDLPSFDFWPTQEGHINSIVYLEPADEMNLRAYGYDMASNPTRAEAMKRARDTGLAAASGRVRLVQEGEDPRGQQAGFLIYVPVYEGGSVPATVDQRRHALAGFVYSPFRADDLLRDIMSGDVQGVLDLDVYDGPPSENTLLHRSLPRVDPLLSVVRTVPVGGRTWTLVFHGADAVGLANRTVVALVVLAGVALSALLFIVTRGQVLRRIAAERTAEELRKSEERLRAADRAKDDFLATISHELRTPLNAIVGWASILKKGTIPPAMQAHAIAVIARNAAAQTRLVEDLLDLSRAVAGHLQLRVTRVDLGALLQGTVEAFRPAADEAGLMLDYEPAPNLGSIEADGDRLQQIVNNLVANAIKFTSRGGRVTLRAVRTTDVFEVTVRDTGIGIDPAFVPHIFDRFRQADSSTTRAHSGAGLGLAITRHLVEMHGGTVQASSGGPGQGSSFTVRLPTAVPPKPGE